MTFVTNPTDHAPISSAPSATDRPARHVLSRDDRADSRTPARFRPSERETSDAGERSLVWRR